MMTTVDRLRRLRAEILRLSEQLLRARAAMERMWPSTQRQYVKKGEHKGKSYLAYVSPVQSSPDPDRLARQLERVDELEQRLEDVKSEAREIIGTVESETVRRVLTRYYLFGWTVRAVASDLRVSSREIVHYIKF